MVAPTFYPTYVRFPATYSRTARGRRIACSGSHQTTETWRGVKRFGSHNGLSVTKSRIRFLWSLESLYYPTKLPEPGGCHHRPVPQSYGSLSRRTAGHGNLGRYLSAQAKNSVGRAPTRNPNRNLTPKSKKQTSPKYTGPKTPAPRRKTPEHHAHQPALARAGLPPALAASPAERLPSAYIESMAANRWPSSERSPIGAGVANPARPSAPRFSSRTSHGCSRPTAAPVHAKREPLCLPVCRAVCYHRLAMLRDAAADFRIF